MIQSFLKKNWHHFAAIAIFLVISVLFCKPITEGKVLAQHDVISWKGMAKDAFDYKEKHGKFPLWNTHLFSGMPNFQVAMDGKSILPDPNKVFTLGLPKPINYFFMACLCFYILCLVLNINISVAIPVSLAFAFSTYNAVLLSAGHEPKMLAIIYIPLLLAGLLLIYGKRYWLGLSISTLAATMEVIANHIQVTFYFGLVIAAVAIVYAIQWIRQKDWKHLIIATSLSILAGLIAISYAALLFMTNYEYSKATMRGGGEIEIKGKNVVTKKTTGLNPGYAFQYSLGKAESFVILMPEAFGGSSGKTLSENSNVIQRLTDKGIPEDQAQQVASQIPKYWGGIDGAGTSGPPYIGALICLLAIIAFVFKIGPIRWGLLSVSVLALIMSWGKYLPGINTFLFEHLPLYNKFRAPSMSLVVLQFSFPILAVLVLQNIFFSGLSKEELNDKFKKILFITAGLFGLLGILYFTMEYSGLIDEDIVATYTDPKTGSNEIGRSILNGLKEDRRDMFAGQIFRSLGYTVLLLVALYAFIKKWMKPIAIVIILGSIIVIDLLKVSREYLSDDFYQEPEQLVEQNFEPNAMDAAILKDTTYHYRVYSLAGDRFSDPRTPYFHRAVGGYHAAKLRIYQDVIDRYMSDTMNMNVLNMLDAKYIVLPGRQNEQAQSQLNPEALGAVWLVKKIIVVDGPVQELNAIGYANPKDTVFVDKQFQVTTTEFVSGDSVASIHLVKFDNDVMEYEIKAKTPQFAVFSEIYYPFGWNAYIDGKRAKYVKVNYILRGLPILAGNHKIEFKFEPDSYKLGGLISLLASIILPLIFFGGIFMDCRHRIKSRTLLKNR